jgi:hypothetical protein
VHLIICRGGFPILDGRLEARKALEQKYCSSSRASQKVGKSRSDSQGLIPWLVGAAARANLGRFGPLQFLLVNIRIDAYLALGVDILGVENPIIEQQEKTRHYLTHLTHLTLSSVAELFVSDARTNGSAICANGHQQRAIASQSPRIILLARRRASGMEFRKTLGWERQALGSPSACMTSCITSPNTFVRNQRDCSPHMQPHLGTWAPDLSLCLEGMLVNNKK